MIDSINIHSFTFSSSSWFWIFVQLEDASVGSFDNHGVNGQTIPRILHNDNKVPSLALVIYVLVRRQVDAIDRQNGMDKHVMVVEQS